MQINRGGGLGQSNRDGERISWNSSSANVTHTQVLGQGQEPRKLSSAPRGRCSPPPVGAGEGEPLGWAGPGMSSLPQVRSERSGWPRRAKHSSPAAHCILAPRGRRRLALGRLGQGSAGFRGQDAHIVRSGDCRYLIASLRGCPAPLRGSPRSAARPLWSCAR